MKKILYAATGHGFGHATRSLAIIRLLRERYPNVEVTLSCAVDSAALQRFIPDSHPHLQLRARDYEPGLVQKTCFEVDPEATAARYQQLSGELEQRVEDEFRYLRQQGYDAVISDIAAIPLAAAARLQLPSLVIGNFTWDWILQPVVERYQGQYPGLLDYYSQLRADYRQADLYLRLPFGAPEHPFRQVEEVPMIGRRSVLDVAQIYRRLGIEQIAEKPLVLVAVGGWSSDGLGAVHIQGCEDYRFLVVGDLPISAECAEICRLPFSLGAGISFPDLVRIADVGVVKPGYGTCSEFVLNGAAMVGIERKHMRETAVMDPLISDHIPFSPLGLEDFFAGRWQAALEQTLVRPVDPAPDDASAIDHMANTIATTLRL